MIFLKRWGNLLFCPALNPPDTQTFFLNMDTQHAILQQILCEFHKYNRNLVKMLLFWPIMSLLLLINIDFVIINGHAVSFGQKCYVESKQPQKVVSNVTVLVSVVSLSFYWIKLCSKQIYLRYCMFHNMQLHFRNRNKPLGTLPFPVQRSTEVAFFLVSQKIFLTLQALTHKMGDHSHNSLATLGRNPCRRLKLEIVSLNCCFYPFSFPCWLT